MLSWIAKRLLQAVFVMLAMTTIVFAGVFAIGDPAYILLAPDADQAERARVMAQFGFDQPLWRQYLGFLANLAHGDLGRSFIYNEPALQLIMSRLPATLELALTALLISIVVGVPVGLYCGLFRNRLPARLMMSMSTVFLSMPTFWAGISLIMIFSIGLKLLPATGRGPTTSLFGIELSILSPAGLKYLILPSLTIALYNIAVIVRLTRAGVLETMPLDFIKVARARGNPEGRIVRVHLLKNITIPLMTVIGVEFGWSIAFAIITETIYSWPGMGKLLIDSINALDRPVIVAYLMVVVVLFTLINLTVDLLYTVVDPRIGLGGKR